MWKTFGPLLAIKSMIGITERIFYEVFDIYLTKECAKNKEIQKVGTLVPKFEPIENFMVIALL